MLIAVKIGSVTESKTVKRASESYTAGGVSLNFDTSTRYILV